MFQCKPIDHLVSPDSFSLDFQAKLYEWLPFSEGTCLPGKVETGTSYAHAGLTGATDLIFAILPVFVVWDLQMNIAMKISVAGLLGFGAM